MIEHKIGNMLDSNADIMIHQTNCQGVMGSGIAKQIRSRFPHVYEAYSKACRSVTTSRNLLGCVQFVNVFNGNKNIHIVNAFAQDGYGWDKQYTDYAAFRQCLAKIRSRINTTVSIAIPWRIGCGRGGGNWDTVIKIIEDELGDCNVTLWELR